MTARSALHSVRTVPAVRKASGAVGSAAPPAPAIPAPAIPAPAIPAAATSAGTAASWPCSSSQDWYRFSPAAMSYPAA
jgi:hypothetical protein